MKSAGVDEVSAAVAYCWTRAFRADRTAVSKSVEENRVAIFAIRLAYGKSCLSPA